MLYSHKRHSNGLLSLRRGATERRFFKSSCHFLICRSGRRRALTTVVAAFGVPTFVAPRSPLVFIGLKPTRLVQFAPIADLRTPSLVGMARLARFIYTHTECKGQLVIQSILAKAISTWHRRRIYDICRCRIVWSTVGEFDVLLSSRR
jgi:hypothetical protein